MKKQDKKMHTVSEFFNIAENQSTVRERIVECLRKRNEWGRRGLFASIGKKIGFSGAYVGQVLGGSKPIRENFFREIARYLGVSEVWLMGQVPWGLVEEVDSIEWEGTINDFLPQLRVLNPNLSDEELHTGAMMKIFELDSSIPDDEKNDAYILMAGVAKYPGLINEFLKIPKEQWEDASSFICKANSFLRQPNFSFLFGGVSKKDDPLK